MASTFSKETLFEAFRQSCVNNKREVVYGTACALIAVANAMSDYLDEGGIIACELLDICRSTNYRGDAQSDPFIWISLLNAWCASEDEGVEDRLASYLQRIPADYHSDFRDQLNRMGSGGSKKLLRLIRAYSMEDDAVFRLACHGYIRIAEKDDLVKTFQNK